MMNDNLICPSCDSDYEGAPCICADGFPDICDSCNSDLSSGYPDSDGCPSCLPCDGVYSPGSEECDWCTWSSHCAKRTRHK
jgi:hypothetical protein